MCSFINSSIARATPTPDAAIRLTVRAVVKKIESGEGLYEELFCIPKSDGGTDIAPVFEFIKEDMEGESKRLLAVLTDGFFYLPQNPPIETLFFVSEECNLERFEGYGKSIRLGL